MEGFSPGSPTAISPLQKARIQLIEGSKAYNFTAVLAIYQHYANDGNAEAMNGLGLIYNQGIGVPVNELLAVEWFEKVAQNNYAKAFYNLATIQKRSWRV